MKKAYCDNCEEEIIASNRFDSLTVKVKNVEFTVAMEDAIPVDYDVCKYCVLDAIKKSHDDRPRCA